MPEALNAWPLATNVQTLLESAGAWDAGAGLDLANLLDTSVEEFESAVECRPFLNSELIESTRTFTAPGPIVQPYATLAGGGRKLFLNSGVLAISSLKIDGVAQTPGVQYWARKFGEGGPITLIEFAGNVFSKPDGIEISGAWGYCSILPRLAFDAVKGRAASKALPILAARRRTTAEASQNSQIRAKETGPVRTEYATATADKTTDFAAFKAQLDDEWRRAVKRFRLEY